VPTALAAVLFDLDGTLVESEDLWGDALAGLARLLGGALSPAGRAATVGRSMPDALRIVYADLGMADGRERLADDGAWVEDRMAELFATDLRWRPGARDLVTAVSEAGLPTAVVTTTARRLAGPVIDRMRKDLGAGVFDITVCGDEVPARKPDPAPYLLAAGCLGADPSCCVAVEDSPVGVRSALAAGAAVLGVPSLQPLEPAGGLVLRDSLDGVGVAELAAVLAGRACPPDGVRERGDTRLM
jgi:HAD superfamily hydrolase (TIGR01509 family)